MSFTKDLLNGIAAYLDDQSVATYRATGAYLTSETAIVVGELPTEPDNAIALVTYPVSDSAALSDSIVGLQVVCRAEAGDPSSADDLADEVFDVMHGVTHVTLASGVHLVQSLRQSGPVTLGEDTNGRWSTVQNFYLKLHRPSTFRT